VGMDCILYQKKSSHHKTTTTTTTNVGSLSSGEQQRNNDDKDVEWEEFDELFVEPQDIIEIQTFPVDEMESDEDDEINANGTCTALRIEFGKSTDFYGRIVIYSLEIWGTEA